MLCWRIGRAAGCLGEFLAIGGQQSRAPINGEVGAFGIDDHRLAKLSRSVDERANHRAGQNAFGIIGQQDDVGARQQRHDRAQQLLLDFG